MLILRGKFCHYYHQAGNTDSIAMLPAKAYLLAFRFSPLPDYLKTELQTLQCKRVWFDHLFQCQTEHGEKPLMVPTIKLLLRHAP